MNSEEPKYSLGIGCGALCLAVGIAQSQSV